jgi:murein DD-endopeptidase / murein LD-carboxypeptidase
MITIPERFFCVKYNGSHYPGSQKTNGLTGGANCQVFAYELLRHFGLKVPDLRSSELWEDTIYTKKVTAFEPLDLLLWNKTGNAYGAHVGVYMGQNAVIHLSKENKTAKIWQVEEFSKHELYKVFIGAKRVLQS